MTFGGRTGVFAAALVAALAAGAPQAKAGDDSEAEKAAAEEGGNAKEPAAVRDEAAKVFEEFRARIVNLGLWCTGFDLALERSRLAEILLAFDPDDAKGREWLGYKRLKNGRWKPGTWRTYANQKPEALAEFAKKRAEFADALRARWFPLIDKCRDWSTAGLRDRIVRSLVNLFPDDAALRAMNGEVLVKGRWLLKESSETPANREKLTATVIAARAEASKTSRTVNPEAGQRWSTVVVTERLAVYSELSLADTQAVVDAVLAVRVLFAKQLGIDAKLSKGTRLMLLPGSDANDSFVDSLTNVTAERRAELHDRSTYWLNSHDCVVASSTPPDRMDSAVRQILADLSGPFASLSDTPPWLREGVGMYMTYRLLGTRLTAFITSGNYSDESVSRELAAVGSDWVGVARKLVDKGYDLDLPVLTGLPLNSMTKDDSLVAYALCAYLVEARPADTAALLAALGQKGSNQHRAMAETFGTDPEGLQVRFARWLHEIPAK